jgi:hypothetical protein
VAALYEVQLIDVPQSLTSHEVEISLRECFDGAGGPTDWKLEEMDLRKK